ncbi:divalent-cation tolerance protein CutA [Arhodomonas aquaeolei]|uniref:divalent-cation tolerance protein CutA n=1 Tax=Arhodomonas TaxID=2368 RepID=UPI0003655D8E|nr:MULTISPECIES: divalent-cation tolerance protein CutA [Arhodomonas]MCS4504319.1 divalent-cation tolerance protein CutA [Arhodomonas aquaeolei]
MSEPHLVALSTCPDRETAERIADALVGGHHAACVNIIPGLTSVYRWAGEVHHDPELLLVAKTTREAFPRLEAAIRENHPDELPEIIAVPIAAGLAGYLQWVTEQTAGAAAD